VATRRSFGDGFLLIEGAGRLDKVTIKEDTAEIEIIQDGFVEPVAVTVVGSTGWVAEGKSSFLFDATRERIRAPSPSSRRIAEVPRNLPISTTTDVASSFSKLRAACASWRSASGESASTLAKLALDTAALIRLSFAA
jgi:hypothetical protein